MLEADPLSGIGTPAALPGAGGPPPGPGMAMGSPPIGGAALPMSPPGGPMGGPMGSPMGMGGPVGGGNQPALKLKATNVWEALDKHFNGDKNQNNKQIPHLQTNQSSNTGEM